MSAGVPSETAEAVGCGTVVRSSIVTKLLAVTSKRSAEAKKKDRSRHSGPPSVAPNCNCPNGAFGRSMRAPDGVNFSKCSRALSRSSRPNAKTFPASSLVPLRVTMLTTPPDALPNSAEYDDAST